MAKGAGPLRGRGARELKRRALASCAFELIPGHGVVFVDVELGEGFAIGAEPFDLAGPL